jgi:hypothetical protein
MVLPLLTTSCVLARPNMQITKEFLETEISELETEAQKAQTFLTQAQATIQAYKMLINRLDAPEPEQQHDDAI